MIHLKQKLVLVLSLLVLCLAPAQASFAADEPGIAFKVIYSDGRYEVFMRSNTTPSGKAATLSSQVTLKVPHGVDANRFEVEGIQNAVDGTLWTVTSRINAPVEDVTADYVSFSLDFAGSMQVYQWAAGQEIKVFSFVNTGTCQTAPVALLADNDPFMVPNNSKNSNPGNEISVLASGLIQGNLYAGSYDSATATCDPDGTPDSPAYSLFLPVIAR